LEEMPHLIFERVTISAEIVPEPTGEESEKIKCWVCDKNNFYFFSFLL